MYLGGIEAGGKFFVCAIGDSKGKILAKERMVTREPRETVEQVITFFKNFKIAALGIGSFGPIDLNEGSATYGSITSTPKLAWADYPLLKMIRAALDVPIGMTTDANVAALGEFYEGAAKGLDGCLCVRVGSGIGAGLITNNRFLQGLTHPEMGHVLLRRHPKDTFPGTCPYHHDCLEGLASVPAIEERWQQPLSELVDNPIVWQIEADYLAQALMQYALILSPKRIVIGGEVMNERNLFPLIRKRLQRLLSGYIDFAELNEQIDSYVVPPALGENAGIIGALIFAKQTYERKINQPVAATM
ncbi:MAG: ROK family protein [Sporolactobacillus sp.]